MFKKEEGFTLVELMVVVLIIGILVAIAIPVFNAARASAQTRTCQANLRTLDGAVQQWAADNILNIPGDEDTASMGTELADYVSGTFPVCPSGGAAAAYLFVPATERWGCEAAGHSY
jgi:type IV pilus assembly protein PilA